ncbi:MAG: NDP-sugar synthase [Kiritimatiellae bacterium]|jgi:NDP-sugar pyrophosphorylase family protein|nr:NDP-sugar synthase [Kiritimatiellia bacterium]
MKTIIIATGYAPELSGLTKNVSAEMLPLLDRPFLQHVVENLIAKGVTSIDFVINEHAHAVEELFATGQRWGSEFKYHLCKEPEKPFELVKNIFKVNEGGCLLVYGNRLAFSSIASADIFSDANFLVSVWQDGEKEVFGGFAMIPSEFCSDLDVNMSLSDFENLLLEKASSSQKIFVDEPMVLDTYTSYLKCASMAMTSENGKLIVSGKVKDESIWISRNVILHPTTKLIPPVYLGKDCRVSGKCVLGPNVVISDGTIIDEKTSIKNSIVLEKSYVGEGLELENVIINKSLLVNAKHNSVLNIPDPYILGNLSDQSVKLVVYRLAIRFAACFLCILTLPILLGTAIFLKFKGVKKLFVFDEFVKLPTVDDMLMWKTVKVVRFNVDLPENGRHGGTRRRRELFYYTIPRILGVVCGKLYVVGLAGRSIDSVSEMGNDWRELYLQGKLGVISEASVIYNNHPNDDELFTAEAFYSVKKTFKHDLSLFFVYVLKLFVL